MKTRWATNDAIRQVLNGLKPNMQQLHKCEYQYVDEREYRYEERGKLFSLKCWRHGVETGLHGAICSRPEWLQRIIDVAAVGGYLKKINQPPPDAIVWFTTDLDNNLKAFLELT